MDGGLADGAPAPGRPNGRPPRVQAACQAREEAARELAAAALARAERAETARDAERAERRALTDRLTAVPVQAGTRNRAAARLPA
jgi:hypothetical protein